MPSLSWKTGCEHCLTTLTGTVKFPVEAFDMSQDVKGVLIDPDLPLGLIQGSKKNNQEKHCFETPQDKKMFVIKFSDEKEKMKCLTTCL